MGGHILGNHLKAMSRMRTSLCMSCCASMMPGITLDRNAASALHADAVTICSTAWPARGHVLEASHVSL